MSQRLNEDWEVIDQFLARQDEQEPPEESGPLDLELVTKPQEEAKGDKDEKASKPALGSVKQTAQPKKGRKFMGLSVPSGLLTPGGIGLLLALILLIVFAISPAPGHNETRLQLAWAALMGRAKVKSSDQTTGGGLSDPMQTPNYGGPAAPGAPGGTIPTMSRTAGMFSNWT